MGSPVPLNLYAKQGTFPFTVYRILCECDISSKLKRSVLGEYPAMSILFWPQVVLKKACGQLGFTLL